jgi:hypothetical protein
MAKANYGSVWNFWPFKAAETNAANYIAAQDPDMMIMCGTFKGKGSIFRGTVAGATPLLYATTDNAIFTVNNDATGVVSVTGPTGGMGQFKGLTQSSS